MTIQFKMYNDDKIRKWYGFPTLKDPNVLENTLAKIFSEYLHLNKIASFEEVYTTLISMNAFFTYYTISNFSSWGMLPIQYIYNDMIRHIQNANTSNNFIMTLESIKIDDSLYIAPNSMINLVNDYIAENYTGSYSYMMGNGNSILVVYCHEESSITAYIISVGFDPVKMSKWFSTSTFKSYMPYGRFSSLKNIIMMKPNILAASDNNSFSPWSGQFPDMFFECAEGRVREKLSNCEKYIEQYEISDLKKKSQYDTEVKYGDFPIDYNALSDIDSARPGVYYTYRDMKTGEMVSISKFNYESEDGRRLDYDIMRKQNILIGIDNKKRSLGK